MKPIQYLSLIMLLFASSCDLTCEASEAGTCAYGHKCKKVQGEDAYSYFPDSSCSATEGPPPKAGKKVYCAQWRDGQCVMPVEVSDLQPLPPPLPRPTPGPSPEPVPIREVVLECKTEFGWPCGS